MTESATSESAKAWPTIVWDAPVFRGLDTRARREIEESGKIFTVEPGETIFRAGEKSDAFFVVAEGSIVLTAIRRGEALEQELRQAEKGASFGEEATIGSARAATAKARVRSRICKITAHVFQRAVGRSGKAEVAERLERILRRAATRDLLQTVAFAKTLESEDIDLLLDAARYRPFERGESIYRESDPSTDLFVVADGMVQMQTDDGERLHVRAYVGRGDFFGDAEIEAAVPRLSGAVASGPSLLISFDARTVRNIASRHPDLFSTLGRIALDQQAMQHSVIGRAAANATQHAFRDLYRLNVARSLLVIDLESCVRCGHCAWACADVHGQSRIVRRGDKMVARVDADKKNPQSLLLPNSCQHCENPSCMIDCPTGAIGRDPGGEVFIREALCTGCGACAKACPWDNISMAQRPDEAPRPAGGAYPDVAVKCELCRGYEGPACVQVCPTGSIFRMNPNEELADVRELVKGEESPGRLVLAPRLNDVGIVLGGLIAGLGLTAAGVVMHDRGLLRPGGGSGYWAGVAAAVTFGCLLLYAAPKRLVRLWLKKKAKDAAEKKSAASSRIRPQLAVHLALGFISLGLVATHAPITEWWPRSAGSALRLAFLLTTVFGTWMAVTYRWLPSRLARIERTAALPEDFTAAKRELMDRLYRDVSGKSDLVKKLFEKILVPYTKQPLGPAWLLLSGRSLRDEENALRKQIDVVLEGRGKERLAGLDGLIRIVVERRALPVQRFLLLALRVGLPGHLVTFTIAVALLIVHALTAVRR